MKNKIAVIYNSKYGSTKQYAELIAQKAAADIFDLSAFERQNLNNYETVLFGSSVHRGMIKKINFVIQNWDLLKEKRVIVFAVGAAPSDDPVYTKIFASTLPAGIKEAVSFFALPGAYDYRKLDLGDKILMHGLRTFLICKNILHKDPKTQEFLDGFYIPQDWIKRQAVEPIISYLKK